MIQIRRAVPEDAALLSVLGAKTFCDTFSGTCTAEDMKSFIAANYNQALVTRELHDENDFYYIASVDDVTAGYLRLKEEVSEVAFIARHHALELKRLYVVQEFHSKKVGAALMAFALNFAAHRHYEIIWLGVWEHNERAKSFYKRFGFVDTGERHSFPIGNTPQTDQWMYHWLKR
jgi:ribosomal protein S18 acetylase RimI-like enzyme